MRWVSFAILAYLAVSVQEALVPQMPWAILEPNAVVVLGLFYSLYGVAGEALLACWILGFLVDLSSLSNVGVNAFGMGFCALAVVGVRAVLFKDHITTQAVLAFLWTLLLQILNGMVLWYGNESEVVGWWETGYVWRALATAAAAPLLLTVLRNRRISRWIGPGTTGRGRQ